MTKPAKKLVKQLPMATVIASLKIQWKYVSLKHGH